MQLEVIRAAVDTAASQIELGEPARDAPLLQARAQEVGRVPLAVGLLAGADVVEEKRVAKRERERRGDRRALARE